MNILLYSILLALPLPLFVFLVKRKHYLYCLPPFVALIGIYLFDIIGSIEVIRDDQLFSYMYYYSLLLIIVLFYLFYMVMFSFKKKLYINWSVTHSSCADNLSPLLMALWSYSFCMLYLYYQRHGLPAVFQITLFDFNDIYAIRSEKSTNLPEGGHWYWFAFSTIPAFIFSYTYILKRLNTSRRTRVAFYLNLPLVLFFSSLTLHKTPFAYLVLYVLLINFFLKGESLGFKKLLGYFAIGIGTIIIMLRFYLLDRSLIDVLKTVPAYFYHRICIVYTKAHAYIIQIFPDQHDFFYGTAFGNPGHILSYEPVNLSQFLGYWVSGTLQNYSAPSFSQGYANFGFPGLMLIILLMFFQIILIQFIFKKCSKNPVFLTLYVLIIPNMLGYANTSIQAIIGEIFVLFSIACIFVYYFSRDVVISMGRGKRAVKLRRQLPE